MKWNYTQEKYIVKKNDLMAHIYYMVSTSGRSKQAV
jgi:hypothetical protein